jgi:hypothetical protein
MNKRTAYEIAKTITNEQIAEMFAAAKNDITEWSKTSKVNNGMTKGASWNVLVKDFDVNYKYHILGKRNMIWEFGEFLPNELKPLKKGNKGENTAPVHQEPKF